MQALAIQQEKNNAIQIIKDLMQHFTSDVDVQELNNTIQSIQNADQFNSTHARIIQRYQLRIQQYKHN